jgi:arylsulfatase A-like enzyme
MADHLRWDCLSCYGTLPVRTPHLDALAAESVVFNRAYCATPLCVPTRTAMYTGKWPHATGAIVNGHSYEEEHPYAVVGPEHRSLYEVLDEAGYNLTHVGIQHCNLEPSLAARVPRLDLAGHDEWLERQRERGLGSNPQTAELRVPNLEWRGGQPVVAMRPQARRTLYPHAAENFLDVFWSRLAAERIQQLDWSQPQYFEALFWAPHPPFEVPEPYFSMYPPDAIELPNSVGQWYPGQPATLLMQSCGQMGAGRVREEYREAWSAYFGLVTMVDECIGRVVAALKATGIWDDALVVFTQDHGEMLGCHHLFQKHCCYEESAHLPLLVKPPGGNGSTPAGERRDHLTSAIDFCPTICDYAGIEPPAGAQGLSWRQAIENPEAAWRQATFIEYNGDQGRSPWPMRAIVKEVDNLIYKYIFTQNDVDELYDLTYDPHETQSLVANASHTTIRRGLRGELGEWMAKTGDFLRVD